MTTRAARILPYGRQQIDEGDIETVVATLRGDFLTTGPIVEEFEAAFSEKVGAAHAAVVSSGTAALHVAVLAAGIGDGDAVIVPAVTFLATANVVRFAGGEVVFADVDPDTGLMTADTLEEAIARAKDKTVRAVLPVHLNGQSVDMTAIAAVARRHNLIVIEDACHALGATHDDSAALVGSCWYGDAAIFSGHPVKVFAMGEGGVVTTNDARLDARIRLLRNHGMVRDPDSFTLPAQAFDASGVANPWYYEMPEIGYNYRASDIHCALGLSQLGKLEQFIDRRSALVARYRELLLPLAPIVQPLKQMPHGTPAWHVAVMLIDFEIAGCDRASVMIRLRESGILTQVLYIPLYRQPYYRDRYGEMRLPGTERYYSRALCLPLFVGVTDSDLSYVIDNLADALEISR